MMDLDEMMSKHLDKTVQPAKYGRRTVLTQDLIDDVVQKLVDGTSQREIARYHGIAVSTVNRVAKKLKRG